MKKIKLKDKEFGVSIPSDVIQKAIINVAAQINSDYKGVSTSL